MPPDSNSSPLNDTTNPCRDGAGHIMVCPPWGKTHLLQQHFVTCTSWTLPTMMKWSQFNLLTVVSAGLSLKMHFTSVKDWGSKVAAIIFNHHTSVNVASGPVLCSWHSTGMKKKTWRKRAHWIEGVNAFLTFIWNQPFNTYINTNPLKPPDYIRRLSCTSLEMNAQALTWLLIKNRPAQLNEILC